MTKAKDFLRRQILEKDNVFFSAINFKRAVDNRLRKKNYSWEANSYKFYPSSIKSLTICPKQYVEEDVHKPPDFELPSIYKMEMGKIIHAMIQDETLDFEPEVLELVITDLMESYLQALDSYVRWMYKREAASVKGRLLYDPPNLPESLHEKLKNSWPEVPGYDESGFSFRADLVIDQDERPCVLDLKTTSIDPEKWMYGEKEKLVSLQEHKLQVRFYRYFFNKHNVYDKKIHKIGLGYINLLVPQGSEGSEFEVWEDLGEDTDLELEELVTKLAEHREDWINGKRPKTRDCTYSKCRVHSIK